MSQGQLQHILPARLISRKLYLIRSEYKLVDKDMKSLQYPNPPHTPVSTLLSTDKLIVEIILSLSLYTEINLHTLSIIYIP